MSFEWSRGRQLTGIDFIDEGDSQKATDGTEDTKAKENHDIEYKYNQNGLRTSKKTADTVTTYEWDDTTLIRETVTYNATDKTYDIWYFYDSEGSVIGFEYSYIDELNEKNSIRIYYEKDFQENVIGLLDSRGVEIATYSYDAWGNITHTVCYEGYETAYRLNHITYRGYYRDNETGFYYLQSRYYDPEICRFINADDLEDITDTMSVYGYNLYCYCESNPILYNDSNGKSVKQQIKSATYSYNRKKAKKYMKDNWKETFWNFLEKRSNNGEFYHYSSDCANYVSQCLYAGGFKMTLNWYSKYTKYKTWYGEVKKSFSISESWRLQNKQREYFKNNYARANFVINKSTNLKNTIADKKIKKGDIIYFSNEGKEYSHAAILYKVSKDTMYYSAHTKNYLDKDIKKFFEDNPKGKVMVITLKKSGTVVK